MSMTLVLFFNIITKSIFIPIKTIFKHLITVVDFQSLRTSYSKDRIYNTVLGNNILVIIKCAILFQISFLQF